MWDDDGSASLWLAYLLCYSYVLKYATILAKITTTNPNTVTAIPNAFSYYGNWLEVTFSIQMATERSRPYRGV